MVLVKAKRDEILEPLSAVSGIIERRHTLPILSNVLIEYGSGELGFLATDIEIQITARAAIGERGEARAITVGARKLLDILRALPEGGEVTLQQQDKRLLVKAGKSRFSLQTLPAEDFPRLATPAGESARFSVPQKALRHLLGMVQYAMAQQDIRYYLNGLLMVVEDQRLKLVATDGHRLAYGAMSVESTLPRQEVIVPRKTVIELGKLLSDGDEVVEIEQFRGVRWVLTDASLKIVSSNAEQEEAQEELDVNYKGEALDIGFNVNYLLDVLNNVGGGEVECLFGDASSSTLLQFEAEPEFRYVVMPMRI
jgi:DNA polymerase-3 subunit beta